MLLGHARGKVGSLVFSRANGEQIVRARAEVVKNPQTTAQMVQRIILNTITQAYSKMAAITDHSFEGIAPGQKSMSYFMKRNLNLLRETLAEIGDFDADAPCFSPLGTNGLASNTYVVAKGQLPEITPEAVSTGGVTLLIPVNTYQGVVDALGLQRGDQVTIVTVCGQSYTNQVFNYSRVILDPREEDGTAAPMSTAFLADGAIVKPNSRNENTGHSYELADGEFIVSDNGFATNMGAVIVSRQKTSGEWMRSNAALILAEGASIGYSMQQCLDALEGGSLDIENPLYLNNARKNAAAKGSVSPTPGSPAIVSMAKDGQEVAKGSSIPVAQFADEGANLSGSVSNTQSGKVYLIAATKNVPVGGDATDKISDSIAVQANGGFNGTMVIGELPGSEPNAICLLEDNIVVEVWCSLTA